MQSSPPCVSGGLRHGWWDGTQWNFEVLDYPQSNGQSLSTLVYRNQLHIVGRGGTIGSYSLRHGWWDGTQWNFETLDAGVSTGETTAVTEYAGQFHVFNPGPQGAGLPPILRHGEWDGTQWNFETLDSGFSQARLGVAAAFLLFSAWPPPGNIQLDVFNIGQDPNLSLTLALRHVFYLP
jgi:hypothetical protein